MSLTIRYCEKCGERVPPDDLESGAALQYRNESYCSACKDDVLARLESDPDFQAYMKARDRQQAVTRLDRPELTPRNLTGRRTARPSRVAAPADDSRSPALLLSGAAVAVVALAAAAWAFLPGEEKAPEPPRIVKPPDPVEPAPDPPPETDPIEVAAREFFADLKSKADKLAADNEHDKALAEWETFSPTLLKDAWLTRVREEKKRIRAERDAFNAHPPIPRTWRRYPIIGPSTAETWTSRGDGRFDRPGGRLILRAKSVALTHYSAAKGADPQELKAFYLGFDFQIGVGEAELWLRAPQHGRSGRPLRIPLSPEVYPKLKLGTWYRGHALARGTTAQFWIDGFGPPKKFELLAESGAVGWCTPPECELQVRKVDLRFGALGKPYLIRPNLHEHDHERPFEAVTLFDGKSLAGWQGADEAVWRVEDGVILGATKHTESMILRGKPGWEDFRFGFELRRLKGQVKILFRRSKADDTHSVTFTQSNFTAADRWYRVGFDVQGFMIIADIPGLKFHQHWVCRHPGGPLGFALDPSSSIELRKLTLQKYK